MFFLKLGGPKHPEARLILDHFPAEMSGPTARQALPKSEGLKAPLPSTKND